MADALTRLWVLIGSHLNTRAQGLLVEMLPTELSGPVREHLRRGAGEETLATEWGPLSPAEERALAGFSRRPVVDEAGWVEAAEGDGDGDDGQSTPADSAATPESAREASPDFQDDGLAPASEEALPGDDGETPDSPLPPALFSLVLLDAPRPAAAAALLVELPLRLQGQVIDLIVTSSVFSATWGLEAEERDLIEGMRERMVTADRWGVQPACEILRAIDTTRRLRRVISATAAIDEDAVTILQNHLFVFADVVRLNDRELQSLLNRVGNQRLACALHDAPDAVRERLLGNMSPRRSRLIEEEGEYLGELSPEEIEVDQLAILETLRQLYEKGEISTYFGSVRGEHDESQQDAETPDSIVAAEEETEEEEPELGVRPAARRESGRKSRRPPSRSGRSRRRLLALLGLVAGMSLVTLVVLEITRSGDGESRRREGDAPKRGSGTGSLSRVLIQDGGEAGDGSGGPVTADPGETGGGVAGAGIDAILKFAGNGGYPVAEVRVEEGSEVDETASSADSAAVDEGLYLRLGRVSCAVVGERDGFVVRTPLVAVRGLPGAVFAVRVVLDATTTVYVDKGGVEVASRQGDAGPVLVNAGQRRRFDP